MDVLFHRSPMVVRQTAKILLNFASQPRNSSKGTACGPSRVLLDVTTRPTRNICITSVISELKKVNFTQSHPCLRVSSELTCSGICRSNFRECSTEAVSKRRVVPNEESRRYLASIGLDCDRLQKTRPTVLKQNVSNLQQHVNLLRSLGLENADIINIIYKEAAFLRKDVKSVYELVEYLKNTGLKDGEVANIFQRAPRFFSTPETVMDNIEYMKYLDVTDKNICYTLIYNPSLFYRVQGGVERIASYLKQVMSEEKFTGEPNRVIRYIMRNDPTLFIRQVSELETNVKFLREFGYHGEDLISIIRYCPSSVRIGMEFLKERMEYLRKHLSLTNATLKDLIRRHPQLLHASVETIQSHIDLVLELGFTKEEMIKTPRIFSRRLSSIRSRYDELTAVGCKPNLSSFIHSKEKHELIVLKFKMNRRKKDALSGDAIEN
uniref:MtDBP protein n=1 Tax=Paracentrotus lividus TaxID=7656 RepID=Q9Y016_PARLI|nr:mtDBP protein [Paracentrotus lividus]